MIWVLALVCAAAPAVAAEELQHLTPHGRVSDFAGVMTPQAVAQVESTLADLERRTGAQVAVVTVPSVPDGDVDRAAVDLFQRWGIGRGDKDNGVLILCAIQDRRARIEVGYGLEGALPDALTGRLMDAYLIPAFRQGDYSTGLVNTTLAVARIIGGESPPADPTASSEVSPKAWLLLFGLFGIFIALAWVQAKRQRKGYRGGWWYGSGGHRGGGGGFGGFGGGSSGGGGASRGW